MSTRCMGCPRVCRQLRDGVGVINDDTGGVVLDTVSTVMGWSAKSSRWCRHEV